MRRYGISQIDRRAATDCLTPWAGLPIKGPHIMFSGQSILGIAASSIYMLVILACVCAALAAQLRQQDRAHLVTWIILAVFFAILIALRAFDIEEGLRQDMREAMRSENKYFRRREVQRTYISGAIILAAMMAFGLVYRTFQRPRGRRDLVLLIAKFAALAMAFTLSARMISLSPIDKLLYGPLKLNWLGDIGSSLVVMAAAAGYVWLVLARRD
jgi:hypothetical protein